MPDCHPLQDHARVQVKIGRHVFGPGADKGVAAMLTVAGWVIQQLPHRVVQRQRPDVIKTLAQAKSLMVVVMCGPAPAIRIYDGQRLLVEIPANGAT